jgi:sterol desaturase/sphingolipid hydroxylase (fatty acid hydroxylase superfamily)
MFELVHYNCHSDSTYDLLSGPRQFHLFHHFVNPNHNNQQNYGFTSATWDLVFGTCDNYTKTSKFLYILLIPLPVFPLIIHKYINT